MPANTSRLCHFSPVFRRRPSRRPVRPLREQAFTETGRDRRPHTLLAAGKHGPPERAAVFIRVAGTHGNNKQQGAWRGSPDCWGATRKGFKTCASSSLFSHPSLKLLHKIDFACRLRASSGPPSEPISLPKTSVPRSSFKTRKDSIAGPPRCPPFLPSVVYPSFDTVLSGRRQQRRFAVVLLFVCSLCACVACVVHSQNDSIPPVHFCVSSKNSDCWLFVIVNGDAVHVHHY